MPLQSSCNQSVNCQTIYLPMRSTYAVEPRTQVDQQTTRREKGPPWHRADCVTSTRFGNVETAQVEFKYLTHEIKPAYSLPIKHKPMYRVTGTTGKKMNYLFLFLTIDEFSSVKSLCRNQMFKANYSFVSRNLAMLQWSRNSLLEHLQRSPIIISR